MGQTMDDTIRPEHHHSVLGRNAPPPQTGQWTGTRSLRSSDLDNDVAQAEDIIVVQSGNAGMAFLCTGGGRPDDSGY